jgi:XTP/dITP diphosphohydrolase
MAPKPTRVFYVTSSQAKIDENRLLVQQGSLDDGTPISAVCDFEIFSAPIKEILEIDISVMVQAEVVAAYSQLKVPCIVEHAGLIFEDLREAGFPGGLTKPMWNALGERFISETNAAGRRVIARAAVAYCDGQNVHVFIGDTSGTLTSEPRGGRPFYWDTIFVPDDAAGKSRGLTYAQIVDAPDLGLAYKVLRLSQSTKAMKNFLAYLRENPKPQLWA